MARSYSALKMLLRNECAWSTTLSAFVWYDSTRSSKPSFISTDLLIELKNKVCKVFSFEILMISTNLALFKCKSFVLFRTFEVT